MPEARDVHRAATSPTSALLLLLGVAMRISTIARGGGPLALGVVLGLLFAAAGGGRLYVGRRSGS